MKIHLENKIKSKAIERVIEALQKYAPEWVEFTNEANADLVVIQVIGRLEAITRQMKQLQARGKKIALVQHAVRSTRNPDPEEWMWVWANAVTVWSHYDLTQWAENLYRSPLGVEEHFRDMGLERKYLACTTSLSYLTEGTREVIKASHGAKLAHLGANVARSGNVDSFMGVSDERVVQIFNESRYVSGLRRVEGFELPAAEGLICGARPILFDREHYRFWYGDMAEYVPEVPREELIWYLERLFEKEWRPVTEQEKISARAKFHWPFIIKGFYGHVKLHQG